WVVKGGSGQTTQRGGKEDRSPKKTAGTKAKAGPEQERVAGSERVAGAESSKPRLGAPRKPAANSRAPRRPHEFAGASQGLSPGHTRNGVVFDDASPSANGQAPESLLARLGGPPSSNGKFSR